MLTDQIFSKPIEVIIGPEVFHAENPTGMNREAALEFQRTICPSGMFRFYYLAFRHSLEYGMQLEKVNDLKALGVAINAYLIDRPARKMDADWIREFAPSVDFCYPTEVLNKIPKVYPKKIYAGSPDELVHALSTQTKTSAAWEWEQFVNF